MANFQLLNNEVYTFDIVDRDAAGDIVPMAAGDVASVVSSVPASVGMAIVLSSAGHPQLVCTPLVIQSDPGNGGGSISAQLSDSAGLPLFQAYLFDVVQNLTPTSFGLDLTSVSTAPQATPTAPGP